MATIAVVQNYTITIDGQVFSGGSSSPDTFTLAGETIYDRTFSVVTGTLTEIFLAGSAATDDLVDWGFLFIESSVAAEICLKMGHSSGTTSTTRHGLVIELRAGVPLMFTGGDASRGDSADVDNVITSTWPGDAAGVIDAVEYSQTSGGASKVRVVAIR